jgi:cystathionine beta-lyase
MKPLKALPLAELQHRRSAKWREFPNDVLPLPVMEMDFKIAKSIRTELKAMTKASDTGYLGPMPEVAQSLAEFAQARWNWSIDTNQVFLATDVGVGMVEMSRMVVNPGDHIVVDTPVYHNFANWIKELKCHIVDAPMKKDGLHYTLNLPLIEEAYKNGAKIHYLCNPQNPTGTVHTKEELSALAELAKKYGVAVFSDEIHAPLTYDASTFTPFLAVSETAREVGITVTSASKAWNIAGLKCAFIVTAHEKWQNIAKQMPPAVHWRASLFGAAASVQAFKSVEWLDACLQTLDKNRALVANLIAEDLPNVGYRVPDTSYVAWLDLTALNLGENPAKTLVERGKVAFNPGITFSTTHSQFVRMNFATSESNIKEAFSRIKRSVK